MAIIYNIADYRKKKAEEALEEGITKLAFGQWESEEEQFRYMTEQAEADLEAWERLYPIPEDIAD